ncbi:MAG: type III-B CRISPR module RAMP protein Cmr4 [Saprospiraceae bacterium]
MFQLSKPLFLTCETPLHAGSGDALGIVDLPIQRERHTSFPKIEASSLKGALREAFEGKKTDQEHQKNIIRAFGPESDASEHAGALGFTDARLLLFPVKSMKGVFAWITCPKVLQQFSEDLKLAIKMEVSGNMNVADSSATPLSDQTNLDFGGHFVLEEYTFSKSGKSDLKIGEKPLADWLAENLFAPGFWQDKAKKDILILLDNDFKDFVNLSTEVITRIQIDNKTGTVKDGMLFTEEYLPAESVLYSLVLASPEFAKKGESRSDKKAQTIMDFFTETMNGLPVIQLGGNATLGKGLLRTKIVSPAKTENHG